MRIRVTAGWLLASSMAVSCSTPTTPTRPSPTVVHIVLPVGIFPGESGRAVAVGFLPDDISVSWSSAEVRVATITPQGVITAIASGTTQIRVTTPQGTGSASLTVYRDSDVLSVTIRDCPTTLSVGEVSACRVVAALVGGVSLDATPKARWSSSNPPILRVEALGLLLARSTGQATVSAAFRGQVGSHAIGIGGGAEDRLRVDARVDQGTFEVGADAEFSLLGFYSVVSASSGQLNLQVSDQSRAVIATTPVVVPRGGDSFQLTARFRIPTSSTRVCPVAILRVGSVTLTEPSDGQRYCITVR